MLSSLILLILCSSIINLIVSYPVEDYLDDAKFYKDGRPPKWNRTSARRINILQEKNTEISMGIQIVGGTNAGIGEIPYQIAILTKDDGHICGGTVYNENFIITAAHCLYDVDENGEEIKLKSENFEVIAGELNLARHDGSEQKVDIKKIIEHPSYDHSNGYNDLAIFQLSKPLEWTKTVQPLRIATKGDNDNKKGVAMVSGWGYTKAREKGDNSDFLPKYWPDTLKKVTLDLYTKPECEKLHKNKGIKWAKHPSFLCAGIIEGGRDSCQADSGGPLACFEKKSDKKFLCGVVASGYGCARKNTPGFYTDVSYFNDWIVQQAGKQNNV